MTVTQDKIPERTPYLGEIVKYNCTDEDIARMKALGVDNQQQVLPAVVVAVWSPISVNLKVFHDGMSPDIWVTSANKGTNQREWDYTK